MRPEACCGARFRKSDWRQRNGYLSTLQQVVDNLDHPLNRQHLLRDYQAAIGIGRGQLRFEGRALHLVLRVSVADALLLVDVQNGRQQRIILRKISA